MLELLLKNTGTLRIVGFATAFLGTVFALSGFRKILPKDQGRKFAVEGMISEGKARGAGIVFICMFAAIGALFAKQTGEGLLYLLFTMASMVTGYLDDASEQPWKDYIKAIFDFLIAAAVTAVYIAENGTEVTLLLSGATFTVPVWLFSILSVALIWLSINVTNCTDGVDGLSGSLGIVTLASFAFINTKQGVDPSFTYEILIFIAVLLAYLLYNANPSTILMGDAGSRAMGTFIAICALKCGDPFVWLLLALVFIADGGLGLLKLFFGRFLKIKIFKNVRLPLHDHVRKNFGWSNTQTVFRFVIIQIVISVMILWLMK